MINRGNIIFYNFIPWEEYHQHDLGQARRLFTITIWQHMGKFLGLHHPNGHLSLRKNIPPATPANDTTPGTIADEATVAAATAPNTPPITTLFASIPGQLLPM